MPTSLVVDALALLRAHYVFPEKAEEAAAAIERRLAAGEYDDLDEAALGERLTAQLFDLCADKHLRVRQRAADLHEALAEAEVIAVRREQQAFANYGIAKVERLAGNIGHLDLRLVTDPSAGGRAIAAAMELVSRTYALIIDLRQCRGGSPDGVIMWNSYLFPDSETYLNSIYSRASGQTRQFWTMSYLPGERYLDRPVYVLTSGTTFSGGEEFCYNLQARQRATLIGETTRGGAHPTEAFRITPTWEITVPVARSINPVTGTNWEGTGVTPDVVVPVEEAFEVAYRTALDHVVATATAPAVLAEAKAARGVPGNDTAG
jgi:C-terminal processing protease CtpA/Prc